MTESYNTGLWEVTLEEDAEDKLGLWEITLAEDVEDELGLWKITLEADEEEEDEAVEEVEEEENIPFDKKITVTVASHLIKVTGGENPYGSSLKVDLPEGEYIAKAVEGACNDDVGNFWAWHVATSAFDLVNGYSLVASDGGYGWAATAADALASVVDIRRAFYWPGGTFELWLPCNDTIVPTNNTGSCGINLQKVS